MINLLPVIGSNVGARPALPAVGPSVLRPAIPTGTASDTQLTGFRRPANDDWTPTGGNPFSAANGSFASALLAQLSGQDTGGDGATEQARASAAYQAGAALAAGNQTVSMDLSMPGLPAPLASGRLLDLVI